MKAALFFLALCAVLQTRLFAQATDCNDPSASLEANSVAQQQWENRTSPVADGTDRCWEAARNRRSDKVVTVALW
jgi:hypothetical protein